MLKHFIPHSLLGSVYIAVRGFTNLKVGIERRAEIRSQIYAIEKAKNLATWSSKFAAEYRSKGREDLAIESLNESLEVASKAIDLAKAKRVKEKHLYEPLFPLAIRLALALQKTHRAEELARKAFDCF